MLITLRFIRTSQAERSIGYMNIQFRRVTPSVLSKFPIWYKQSGGVEVFSNFIPSTFISFEKSKDLRWF